MANRTHNYYLPYLRSGMAARVKKANGEGQRVILPVTLNIESRSWRKDPITRVVRQKVALYGPGDVLGFDPRIIVKTTPAPFDGSFPANLIPYIEFGEADFLWRYSSAKAYYNKYWIPWLSLIILKDRQGEKEGEYLLPAKLDPKLPAQVLIAPDAILPDLSQSWRWSHVHINEAEGYSLKAIRSKIERSPKKAVCRLIGARSLEKQTKYCAFVVPTYTLGLEAAMGLDLDFSSANSSSIVNWQDLAVEDAGPAKGYRKMPYYYKWEFNTGSRADFEYAIKQLEFRRLTDLGKRTIDCSKPGYGLQSEGLLLEMEGALCAPDIQYQEWGMDIQDAANPESPHDKNKINPAYPFPEQVELKELVNKSEITDESGEQQLRVVPPIYGRWYDQTGNEKDYDIDPKQGEKNWIAELNLDFRHRVAAGLGVQFVKDNQEMLMKSAWQQLAEVRKVNRTLNLGRFGRAVSKCMYKRLKQLPQDKLIQLGLPLKFKVGTPLNSSRVASSRRVRSGNGPGKNMRTLADKIDKSRLSNNASQLKMKKYLGNKVVPKRKRGSLNVMHEQRKTFQLVEREDLVSTSFNPNGLGVQRKTDPHIEIEISALQEEINMEEFANPIRDNIDPKVSIEKRLCKKVEQFRKWESRHKPEVNFESQSFMVRASGTGVEEVLEPDPLRDIIWYPEFHTPLYHYLRKQSHNLLLPGMDIIPQNTVSVLTTNPRFIESFMIGVNHEFAAELRWREFPTDMRGSYFRKFWDSSIYSVDKEEKRQFAETSIGINLLERVKRDHSDYHTMKKIEALFKKPVVDLTVEEQDIMQAYEEAIESWLLTREEEKDIMHPVDWSLKTRLGSHNLRANWRQGDKSDQMVLLIRGTILQKFPNMLVYLVPKKDEATPDFSETGANKKFPVFEGNLPPDISFLGFPITEEQKDDYFLVFEERMSELKYGLDETDESTNNNEESLANIAWQHFQGLKKGDYLDKIVPNTLEAKDWNNPALIAKVFTQKSVRVAIALNRFF